MNSNWIPPELRNDLVTALSANPAVGKGTTLRAMARNNIGEWGIEEAVPVLISILKAKSENGGPIDGPAVVQLKALGTKAREALPLLERLLEERKSAGTADFREIEALEFAVTAIGAPVVSSGTKGLDTAQARGLNRATGDGATSVRPPKVQLPTLNKSGDVMGSDKSAKFSWWLIAGSVAMIVIVIATWFKMRNHKW